MPALGVPCKPLLGVTKQGHRPVFPENPTTPDDGSSDGGGARARRDLADQEEKEEVQQLSVPVQPLSRALSQTSTGPLS